MNKSKKRWRRRLSYWLGGIGFKLAKVLLVRKDPVRAEIVGQRLGRMAYRIAKKHRTRAEANLALCYPEWSETRRLEISKKCFEHFGMLATDFLRSDLRTDAEVLASYVAVDGLEDGLAAHAQGKGVIAMAAHFGNWERAARWGVLQGTPLTVVQRDANDEGMNSLMTEMRQKAGVEVISRGNAIRAILESLKRGRAVAILADQNSSEAFLPFFGHPTGTVLGPAVIHLRTGAPIVLSFTARIGPNQYRQIIRGPLKPDPAYEDPRHGLMAAYNQELEHIVREYPEQWLWLHDRWKSARRKGLLPTA